MCDESRARCKRASDVEGSFRASDVVDVSIPGFAQNPYQADANAHLLGVAWRPGACDGLIGGARGQGTNPWGMVIRFEVTAP